MPKPRHLSVEDNGDSAEACKLDVMSNPNMTKKRSVTEPARPEDILENNKADKNSQKEKMKSRVAALRSKLSLKDLAKEFRRDSSKNEPAAGNEGGQSSGVDTQDFNEEKLYVPKPRELGVYPSSAPPFPFRDISFGQFSQTSVESCAVASSMANDEQPNNEKLSLGPFAGRNAMQSPVERESERKVQLDTLLLTGSSPAARAGELENSGQAQVIREQPSIRSLRAENDLGSPASTNISFYAVEDEFADPISPSIYDNASAEMTPELPNTAHRRRRVHTNEHRFPVMRDDSISTSTRRDAHPAFQCSTSRCSCSTPLRWRYKSRRLCPSSTRSRLPKHSGPGTAAHVSYRSSPCPYEQRCS
jgi:hypothetical protein